VLYVFLILRHDHRRIVLCNVTTSPTAQMASQQIVESFLFEEVPRFLMRDRDGTYGPHFRDRVGCGYWVITTRTLMRGIELTRLRRPFVVVYRGKDSLAGR